MEQHIGLGHEARILALEAWWPVSGCRQRFVGVGKNRYIEISEFADGFKTR